MSGERSKGKESSDIQAINVNVNVEDLVFEKDRIVARYTHTTTYAPDVGSIKIVGELYIQEDDKTRRELEDQWKKTKQVAASTAEDLLTSISYTASAVGTLVAFGLGISAPINVPRARLAPAPQSLPGKPAGSAAG